MARYIKGLLAMILVLIGASLLIFFLLWPLATLRRSYWATATPEQILEWRTEQTEGSVFCNNTGNTCGDPDEI